ncbi:MAG: sel1 repeat family protein [Deltaproteobacteria bacterium]|jgi:TPR repeat protein|nr:sel1 repeat family protein [Deltaproteobacteria bacterium]
MRENAFAAARGRLVPLGLAFLLAAALIALPARAGLASELSDTVRSAKRGNPSAQYKLGVMYDNGYGVRQNHAEAAKWYYRAAMQGHPSAQYNLAVSYDIGEGCPIDHQEAAYWYLKAANQGHPNAMFNLAVSYIKGTGVRQNTREGIKWFRRAARKGHKKAREMLYEIGDYDD